MQIKRSTFICLFAHNASEMFEITLKKTQKSILKFVETLKRYYLYSNNWHYMYTCLSHVLRRKKSFYVHFNNILNFQVFKTAKQKGWNLQNNWAVSILTCNKLCLILNFLCSTAYKGKLQSMAMQQTGTVLGLTKFTNHRVSSRWICYKECQEVSRKI